MSNDKRNEFAGEILTPEIARKQILEIGKVQRETPVAGIFDEPTRCFKANLEWTPHILGMVHWLADVTAWQEADDEGYFAIQEILRFMQGEDCMSLQLRQKPDNGCVLQQSLDAGVTWSDVFDFSLCVTIQDMSYQVLIQNQVTNAQQTFIDIYNNYTTNYSGLPSDVYPNLSPPVGDDSALKAARCNAIWELVRTACDSAVSFYTETINQSQGEANLLLAIAGFTFTAIALAAAIPSAGASLIALGGGAALVAAGVGLGAGLANYLIDFYQQHTIDQFQDTVAMEDVACFIFDCLDGTDSSLDDFRSCLAGTIMGANAQTILDFMEILFEHDSIYAAFLEKWSKNQQYADVGIDLYCPCTTNEYRVVVWDFASGAGQQGWSLAPENLGVWDGDKWKGTVTGAVKAAWIVKPFDPSWRVHAAKLYLTREGGIAGINDSSSLTMRPTPNSNTGATNIQVTSGQANGDVTACNDFAGVVYVDSANQVIVRASVKDANPLPSEIYITRIEIVFIATHAPSVGYLTEDLNICT